MTSGTVITDRQIQAVRDRAFEADDQQLGAALQQLLDFREHGRAAVAEHDFFVAYNGGISWMRSLVEQSGCQWWQCDQPARTVRMMRRAGHSEACWLCLAHADEGAVKGSWDEAHPAHPNNARWKAVS